MQIIDDNTQNKNEILQKLKGKYEVFSLDDFKIIFFHINKKIKRKKFYHSHLDYEFIILLTTIKNAILDGKKYIGETDTVYPISPNRYHGIEDDIEENSSYIDIYINNNYFNSVLKKLGYKENSEFNYNFPFHKKFAYIILRFSKIYKSNNPIKIELLNYLKEFICEELIIEGLSEEKNLLKHEYEVKEKFDSILNYVATNYNNPEVVDNAAKLYDYTKGSFGKIFSKHYHIPINQFILKIKLSNSKMLLKYSELSLDDIAKECGFKNAKYFSEIFTKKSKISPSKYRKNYKGIKEKSKNKTNTNKYEINDELIIYSEVCYTDSSIIFDNKQYSYFLLPLSMIRINETMYLPQNLFYFEANEKLNLEHIKNSTFYVLGVRKDFLDNCKEKYNIDFSEGSFVDNIFIHYIENIISKWNEKFKISMQSTLLNIIKYEILYSYLDTSDLYYKKLKEIAYENLEKDNISEVICKKEGYNLQEFNRIFYEKFKITPFQFLIHCRLLKSIELLNNNETRIDKIAKQSGFSSIDSFNYYFKIKYKMTPKKYIDKNFKKQEKD